MPTVVYAIDTELVNDRIDWRSQRFPGPIARQRVGYPGSARSYVRKGQPRGTRFVLRGFLQGANRKALNAEIDKYHRMRADLARHTVTWHDIDYPELDLAHVQTPGDAQGFRHTSGDVWLRQRVSMVWEEAVG
ncbi:MAG: hypothetical protein AAF797_07025 [Planctomycetota bacterium]